MGPLGFINIINVNICSFYFKQKPLWTFGWNCKIGLKSILNEDFNETNSLQIFFVTDQIGIVFEFNTINKEKCMNMLTGHVNIILYLH